MNVDDILISFDVDALYQNTLMKESIKLLEKRIKENINLLNTVLNTSEIIKLVKICTSEVYLKL